MESSHAVENLFTSLMWLLSAPAILVMSAYIAYRLLKPSPSKHHKQFRKQTVIGIYVVLIFMLVLPSLLSRLEIWPYNANKLAEEQRVKNQREYNLIRSKPKDWLEDARHKGKK